LLGERLQGDAGPPAARLQRDKRPAFAEDFVMDVDAADLRDGHGFLPGQGFVWRNVNELKRRAPCPLESPRRRPGPILQPYEQRKDGSRPAPGWRTKLRAYS